MKYLFPDVSGRIKEIYNYRTMLYSMIVRNLKGRYKNSYLGFAWHFLTPAIMVVLFYIVFTTIRLRSMDYYWIYLCVGMFPFTFLQSNLTSGAGCIISNSEMVKKIYFPKEIIIISQTLSSLITFVISYTIVIFLIIISGYHMNIVGILFLPIITILMFIFATGYTFITSAVTVFVRDVQYFIQAFGRVLFWITPVFYAISDVTGLLNTIIWCNPYTYFIESFHNILYYGTIPNMTQMTVIIILTFVMLIIGVVVFNRYRNKFAEYL